MAPERRFEQELAYARRLREEAELMRKQAAADRASAEQMRRAARLALESVRELSLLDAELRARIRGD